MVASLFLQKDVEKSVVDADLAVVFDEAQFSEAIHEKTDSGPGGADHLSQEFLADFGNYRLGFAFLAELREEQQNPRQPLFAGIEKLIDQVRLDASIACKKKGDEHLRQLRFLMKHAGHFRLADPEQCTIGHGGGGREPNRMGRDHAVLSQKLPGTHQGDRGFFSVGRGDRYSEPALLYVKNGV